MARNRLYIICCILLFAVAIILIWNILERERDFKAQQQAVRDAILSGASGEITAFVRNYQQRVHIFADEYSHLLDQLASFPEDEQLVKFLEGRLDQRFPDYTNYALTQRTGEPVLDRYEQDIGAICRADLAHFSHGLGSDIASAFNDVYIHPHPLNYHFDVMSGWQGPSNSGIFLVSYPASVLARMLNSHQIPGHELMLITDDNRHLIEITAAGGRDTLNRDIELNNHEMRQWSSAIAISGSRWKLIDSIDPELYQQHSQALRIQAGIILLVIFLASLLILLIGRKELQPRLNTHSVSQDSH